MEFFSYKKLLLPFIESKKKNAYEFAHTKSTTHKVTPTSTSHMFNTRSSVAETICEMLMLIAHRHNCEVIFGPSKSSEFNQKINIARFLQHRVKCFHQRSAQGNHKSSPLQKLLHKIEIVRFIKVFFHYLFDLRHCGVLRGEFESDFCNCELEIVILLNE